MAILKFFLIYWWMLLLWAVAIAVFFGVRYWLDRKRKRQHFATDVPVAHTTRLTDLPEFIAALKKYKLLVRICVGALSIGLLASIILTARPANISNINPEQKNRDIMLCLDVSGSVLKTDTAIINRFSALTNNFNGQRFGLTLFNSSAVTTIPLNDNYRLINQQLKSTGQAFQSQTGDTFARLTNGTLAGFESGTSLASDGLASCVLHLGASAQNRSRSIILATDNEVNGTPIVGMVQSIALAKDSNIQVFVIDPGVSDPNLIGDHGQLKIVASETDGGYYQLSESDTVKSIVDAIAKQKTARFIGSSQPAVNDIPKPFLYIAVICIIISLVLLWRLEL
jgi:Ca-activated chloride channel family protein